MEKKPRVTIIGAGFAGLTAAALLAKDGCDVTVIEKNEMAGGRARTWQKDGFLFDMGPSWYWMPDVFENYYNLFGKTTSDFYALKRLSPSYRIYFGKQDTIDVPATLADLYALFEKLEPGSSKNLKHFLDQAKYKYDVGMNEYVFKPSHSVMEYFDPRLAVSGIKLQLLGNMRKHVYRLFKNERLRKLLEFPVLFLGATPQNTPALYSLMNYADLILGTWYPMGGMHKIVAAMQQIAESEGAKFIFDTEVTKIEVKNNLAEYVITNKGNFKSDFVVGNADYHHIDQHLFDKPYRNYNEKYWNERTMAPSCLLFYIGLNKKLDNILHHNLFFDEDFDQHAEEIYTNPQWPSKPLFYACCPSVTDKSVAPEGCENLFFLIPVAPDLADSESKREEYFNLLIERFKDLTGNDIGGNILFKRSYAMNDFVEDYHAFKGNAYGLANTLKQTAFLKPKMKSKVTNFLYTGQLTVPGPGVPPAIISGQVVAKEIKKKLKKA
ncbi:phytoene desaturase [Pedobacter sp. ISL-68]|uniref:phytoene desaturase family protein n=1 Tax=unclassified Pedobacter TaxID=2628915 RepID=UPI001BE55AA1|nr:MULTISPECIES: phytoene desaturase family protein [unclassified Pedobacter]MBT2560045.1 phytoene desaturase [Pedobacter sp. ISL-64]MBT2592349.1 phytoene desaturase [Pedobacter sp. ISL-68]